jgi:hypothetical protein
VQQELQEASELAQQAVARQVGLPGLTINTSPGESAGQWAALQDAGFWTNAQRIEKNL